VLNSTIPAASSYEFQLLFASGGSPPFRHSHPAQFTPEEIYLFEQHHATNCEAQRQLRAPETDRDDV